MTYYLFLPKVSSEAEWILKKSHLDLATSVTLHTDVHHAFPACLDSDFHFGCVHPRVLKQNAGPQNPGHRTLVTRVPLSHEQLLQEECTWKPTAHLVKCGRTIEFCLALFSSLHEGRKH